MSCYDPSTSILAGMDESELRAQLAALQRAYLELSRGAKVASASYTQNGNARSTSFTQTTIGDLTAAIRLVQAQLGLVPSPRRPIGVKF